MSNDPVKLGFFIWPWPNFMEFHNGKDLSLLSSTTRGIFEIRLVFQNCEHLKSWCFSRKLEQIFFGILLLELLLNVTPISLNIFIHYFAVKCKVPCWTKQDKKFFTGDFWALVNCCYKATCFSCAFKHDDILNTYNSNNATSIFSYLRAGVMEILLYLGDPCLSFHCRLKKLSLYTSMYQFKYFFNEHSTMQFLTLWRLSGFGNFRKKKQQFSVALPTL